MPPPKKDIPMLKLKTSSEYNIHVDGADYTPAKAELKISLPYRFEDGNGKAEITFVDENENVLSTIKINFPSPGSNLRSIFYEIIDATREKISEIIFNLLMFCITEKPWAEPNAQIESPDPDHITILCKNGTSFSVTKPTE